MLTLEAATVRAVVDHRLGEVLVTVKNETDTALRHVRIELVPAREAGAHLDVIPGAKEGGYALDQLARGAEVKRVFAIRPVDAPVGSVYALTAKVEAMTAPDQGHGEHVRQTAPVSIEIQARPEYYLALGALNRGRVILRDTYAKLVEEGRDLQRERPAQFPDAAQADPVRDLLSDATFDWARDLAAFGLRALGARKGDKP